MGKITGGGNKLLGLGLIFGIAFGVRVSRLGHFGGGGGRVRVGGGVKFLCEVGRFGMGGAGLGLGLFFCVRVFKGGAFWF